MSKKIFHIFDAFIDFLLKVIWLKPFFKFLKRYKKIFLALLGLIFLALILFFSTWDQNDFLFYKKKMISLSETHKSWSYFVYFMFYFAFALLGLPGTAFLGVVGGFIFGFLKAFIVSLFAVMLGSSASFLIVRLLLRDFFISSLKKSKKALKLNKIYSRLKENEVYYLFMFRLLPITPLAITNIVMGLGEMKFKVFFIICFLTIAPYLIIYIGIGSKLSQLEAWEDLYDPILLVSLTLLAVLPLLTKYIFRFLKKRLKKEDFDLKDTDLISEDFIVEKS